MFSTRRRGWPWRLQSVAAATRAAITRKIQNWVEKSGKKYPGKPVTQKKAAPKSNPDRESMKKWISKANEDWNECLKASANNGRAEFLLSMIALTADLKILEIEINK